MLNIRNSLIWVVFAYCVYPSSCDRPNVVFIVADDLGWNDLGFHNSEIISPNVDKLAKTGVTLNQSYVQFLCTPSRSTFMTGYYPFRTGMQHTNLQTLIPAGVPVEFPFLPEKMRSLGYDTHMVGKWHLGYCNWSYTPTYRGFDTFLGYYTGDETYYTHEDNGHLDFRNNTEVERNLNGTYSTFIYKQRAIDIINYHNSSKPLFMYLPFQAVHAPLQAPDEYIALYKHIKDASRRNFSAMVTAMDDAIGAIVQALKTKGLFNNTVLIFTTDNGGQVLMGGNNYPLRGNKATLWEGGTRGIAFVHSPLLNKTGYINNEIMHSVDWFPTIVALGGGKIDWDMDGVNQWPMINSGLPSARTEFVYNIDNYEKLYNAAIRVGDYKLIVGDPGKPDGWYPPKQLPKSNKIRTSFNNNQFHLFNLKDDPTEHFNLAKSRTDIVKKLWKVLMKYDKKAIPPYRPKPDPAGAPKHWGGVYSPGWCAAI